MTILYVVFAVMAALAVPAGMCALLYYFFTKQSHLFMETKTKALDVFLYLGIFITLVTSVTNVIQIIFSAIERKFTDVLEASQYVDIYGSDVRMAIAILIVIFPIYLALSWYVSRDISIFTYKKDLGIRKLFIYTTLFVTLVTLVGTLVSAIYTYLGGELTSRFGLKALTVFVIAIAVFGYYIYSLRRDYSQATKLPLFIAIISAVLVFGSLWWSVSVIGTPADMRMKRIDDTRLSDISRIQQEVYNHFNNAGKLPVTLSELNNAFQGYVVPSDPVTKDSYGYTIIQIPVFKQNFVTNKKELEYAAVFELCATFDTVREYDNRGTPVFSEKGISASNYYYTGDVSPFWNHGKGTTCFKRIISPDMYYGR